MADNEEEIIKRIEAEAIKPIVPEVLSSKRSNFLNKEYKCSEVNNLSAAPKIGRQTYHWFKLCSLYTGNNPGAWHSVPLFGQGNVYRCFSWFQNPLNSSYPNVQEAFYQYIIQNIVDQNTGTVGVPQLNLGDQVTFNLGPSPTIPIGPPPYSPLTPSGGDEGPYATGVCLLPGYAKAFKVCIEYMGKVTNPSVNNPGSTASFHGFITPALSPPFTFRINQFCCQNIPTIKTCYEIGDIGPEGGIIFSIPGVGINTSTNIYYEVAQNDIDTATTPSSCFNISCGDEVVTYDVTNGKATHQMLDDNEFTFYWNDTPNPPYPNPGSNPPPQVGDTITAITPNLFADALGNPISTTTILSITPSTHPSGHGAFTVKIADQLTAALDQSGNITLPFKFSLTTTVISPCTGSITVPISYSVNTSVSLSPGVSNNSVLFGYGTGSLNVNFDPSNLNNGDSVSGLDINGVSVFPSGSNPIITSIVTYPASVAPNPTFTTCFVTFSVPMVGASQSQPAVSITFTSISITGTTPFGLIGSEWGAYNIPHSGTPPTIQTSLNFGLGLDNTDIIHTFPGNPGTPTGGTHPWLNTHNIAATVCKNHGTTNDWFLPSLQEFKEMFTNVGPGSSVASQITFNPLTQKSEHLYWTSSQYIDNGTGLQDPDKYAYAYDTITNNPKLAYRCHTLSVRPIRKFECEVEPLDPCKDPMVPNPCNCVEYNYRDGMHTGSAGYSGMILTWSSNTSSLTNPLPNLRDKNGNPVSSANTLPASDSSIGGEYMGVMLPTKDVMGNVYSASDIQNNMDSGMTFTLYDVDYTFLGKWRYDTIESFSTLPGTPNGSNPYKCQVIVMVLKNVTHLEGNIPQLLYDDPNWGESLTHVFFKVEHEMINNSTSGCNSFLWGNAQFPNPQGTPGTTPISIGTNEFAHACDSTWAPPTWVNSCIKNLLVYQPSTAVQHANYSDCAPTCGAASINHCFSICGVFAGGSWNTPSNAWFGGEPYGPMAMENNPIGVTSPPFGSNPPGTQDYTAFYDWLTLQFQNPLTIGDTFIFQTAGYNMQISYIDSNGNTITGVPSTIICFKYEGMQNYNIPINVINNNFPLPIVAAGYCCQTGGSSLSLIIPVENDYNSIKLEFEQKLLSKRQKFIELRKPKKTGPFGILGYYPLYDNIDDAIENSPNSSYHIHEFNEQEFYMPNGLEMGVTQFHGDWNNGEEIQIEKTFNYPITTEDNIENDILLSDPISETIETPDIPTVTPPPIITEPEEEPETTYTPPPTPPSSGGGGSGGY